MYSNIYDRQPVGTVSISYISGVSEDIRRICRCFNIRVAFRSGTSLQSMLSKVKDPLPIELQSGVVYRIPCSCGKSYIGETTRRLETRLKEHRDDCRKQNLQSSAVADHAWTTHCPIKWEETTIVDRARTP